MCVCDGEGGWPWCCKGEVLFARAAKRLKEFRRRAEGQAGGESVPGELWAVKGGHSLPPAARGTLRSVQGLGAALRPAMAEKQLS